MKSKKRRAHAGKKVVPARKYPRKKTMGKKRGTASKGRAVAHAAATEIGFSPELFFKAKIKVIGIGGGGGSIVSDIGRALNKASFVVADTDARAFRRKPGIKNFLFGQGLTHGLGTGMHIELAKKAAEAERDKIAKLFEGQDIIIFIASLGGGLGSGATQVFAEVAKSFPGITFGIFTLPFRFEGKNKQKIASRALRELRRMLNVSITIPNERIFKVIDSNTAITDAFSMVNRSLIESLESLIDLIYSPGIINIDFADLKAILRGKGNLAFLNTAEASGTDRADKIIKEILHNPLYQHHNIRAEKVLFNISGGENLNMLEVDKISRVISEQSPNAKIIFGISRNPKQKNRVKTTLLMTGPASDAAPEKPVEAKSPATIKKTESAKKKSLSKVKRETVKKKKNTGKKGPAKDAKVPREEVKGVPMDPVVLPDAVFQVGSSELASVRKLSVVDSELIPKKNIRRTALEIKREEDLEAEKRSKQEEEWEIPAFLRIKK